MATILAVLSAAVPWLGAPTPPVAINVRWAEGLAAPQQREVADRFGLTGGQQREGRTWSYTLHDQSTGTIRALVQHPSVEDTSNLDRTTFRPLVAPRGLPLVAIAVFALAGALVRLWLGESLRPGVFWGLWLLALAAAIAGARMRPASLGAFVGAWPLAVPVAAFVGAAFVALRAQVPVSPRVAQALAAGPPVALAGAVGLVVLAAAFGYEPLMRDDPPVTLLEAVREGDEAMVFRLLRERAAPGGGVTDADRALLEAAVTAGTLQTLKLVVGAVGPLDAPTRSRLISLARDSGDDVLVAFLETTP